MTKSRDSRYLKDSFFLNSSRFKCKAIPSDELFFGIVSFVYVYTVATCRSLLEGEEHFWNFLRVQGIEPTNNAAGQALRHAILWRKSSGWTASDWGSRFAERVLSVVATCRQQGRDVLDYLTSCFEADCRGRALPSLLPVTAAEIEAA